MNMVLNAIASSNKIYQVAILLPRLLTKAIAKPKYTLLCLWAFKQLWWVDSRLKDMALEALKVPADPQPVSLNSELTKEIRQRAIAIAWTAKIHPLRPKCLHRSLVLYKWLQEQGINAQLEIGWGENIGHAWVTYDGKVLNDRTDIASITPRLMKV
ncbi:MAG: lasso peptide biosynthesis B2 protein [Hyellaceae cyanobacterium CSU_1_1]|nr:lasso peptide biosynthesis B2 protein [Pleurocapsa sp. CRU_1_2]NJR45517.1 lasso peptide biosynthesis B2 protein [Hyellaceae cyanobacterium CSU_1_1]